MDFLPFKLTFIVPKHKHTHTLFSFWWTSCLNGCEGWKWNWTKYKSYHALIVYSLSLPSYFYMWGVSLTALFQSSFFCIFIKCSSQPLPLKNIWNHSPSLIWPLHISVFYVHLSHVSCVLKPSFFQDLSFALQFIVFLSSSGQFFWVNNSAFGGPWVLSPWLWGGQVPCSLDMAMFLHPRQSGQYTIRLIERDKPPLDVFSTDTLPRITG